MVLKSGAVLRWNISYNFLHGYNIEISAFECLF